MKILIRLLLIFVITCSVIGICSSCSEDSDCSMSGRPMVNCKIFTINPDTKEMLKDTLDSLTITALGTDSIILNNQKNVTSLLLPLRYSKDTTTLVLHYDYIRDKKAADTIVIIHHNTAYFQSMECGYAMKQTIKKTVIKKAKSKIAELDSIYIRNNEANTNEIQNLDLYYRYSR